MLKKLYRKEAVEYKKSHCEEKLYCSMDYPLG